MRMKHIEKHASYPKRSRYYDERQRQEQQYNPLHERIHLFYELDEATIKSLTNQFAKMVDATTYDRLNIERKIDDALAGALNIDRTDVTCIWKN